MPARPDPIQSAEKQVPRRRFRPGLRVSLTEIMAKEKRILLSCPGMARRPAPEELDRPLNREELAERQRRLALLSPHHVAQAYRQAHEACRIEGDRLPRASAVQELVTAWRVLWRWRRRGPTDRG